MDDNNTSLLDAVKALAEALRADVMENIGKLSERIGSVADSVKKIDARKKADEAGERDRGVDGTMATRVAAAAVDPAAFAALRSEVSALKKTRPTADLNAFADVQAKAYQVLRTHNERADPPMHGEDLVSYKIRTHRAMQKHSAK